MALAVARVTRIALAVRLVVVVAAVTRIAEVAPAVVRVIDAIRRALRLRARGHDAHPAREYGGRHQRRQSPELRLH